MTEPTAADQTAAGPEAEAGPEATIPYALLIRGANTAAHGVQVALPRGTDGEPERILLFQGEAWELMTQSPTPAGHYEYGNPRAL